MNPFTGLVALLPSLVGAGLVLLATHVARVFADRARGGGSGRWPWLVAASVAFAAGSWALALLSTADLAAGTDRGVDFGLLAAAAGAALVLSLLALQVGTAAAAAWRPLASALLGGLAVIAAPAGLLLATGLVPEGVERSWAPALAAAAGAGGFAVVLALPAASADGPGQLRRGLGLALALLAAQALFNAWADLDQIGPAGASVVALAAWPPLTTVAVTELLLLLLLVSLVEARLRGGFERAQQVLHDRAHRDRLTGLPNRAAFEETLARETGLADQHHEQVALLLVGLDDLGHVNEQHGHAAGDDLLQQVGARLTPLAAEGCVARLGGDEFLLLLRGADGANSATALAGVVLERIAQPVPHRGLELTVSASVGVALYPQHGATSSLIARAGVAMRVAKSAGGATYVLFDPRMVIDNREQAELLRDLRLAVQRKQLELVYQPKVHAPSAQITGVEALLRWHHPIRGTISPTVFVPLAERAGLINAIGDWVIDEACRQARAWRDDGLRMRVAVNLSAHQLRRADLPQRIAAALKRHQINPDLLTCEITESVAMEDTDLTLHLFAALHGIGVHISIDDFGSGYSSLAYLRKLPARELKIDRAFVCDLETSEEARKIAAAVVHLAQALQLKVVAEGVETEEQFQMLRRFGCDELQGFLFARPMSARALGLWARDEERPQAIQFRESLFQETQTAPL